MKNILYILIFACGCLMAQAQIQQENFNAGGIPTGWTATTPASGCVWQFGYTGVIPGSASATFPSGGVIFSDEACGAGQNNRLELEGPEVDLVTANVTSAAIDITYNHQSFAGDGDFLVDVWDGGAWQNVLTVTDDAPASSSSTNQTSSIDVTAYINANFKVRFVYDDENSLTWGVGIDNYELIDTATASIEELIAEGFSYYPNPVDDNNLTLNANEAISAVAVYNLLGQTVYKSSPNSLQSTVEMAHLPVGAYIVNVAVGEKKGTFKILKQ